MSDTDAYSVARKRAEAKYGFLVHLAVYCAVMVLLFIINLLTYSDSYWVIWPFLGWGIALVFHALSTFVFPGRSQIIDRLTESELRNSKSRKP